jgi:beta-N-acetylhexosaminidase
VTDTWSARELEPFRAVISAGVADAVMVANLVNRRLDPHRPASLSRSVVTGMLRQQLGWNGVVVTDDLGAKAVTAAFGQAEAIALAIEAGNDLLLLANQQSYDPNITRTVTDMVLEMVAQGRISQARIDTSAGRVARLRAGVAGG